MRARTPTNMCIHTSTPVQKSLPSQRHSVTKRVITNSGEWDKTIYCKVLYDFYGDMPCDLQFKKGQRISVVTRTESQDDWWEQSMTKLVYFLPIMCLCNVAVAIKLSWIYFYSVLQWIMLLYVYHCLILKLSNIWWKPCYISVKYVYNNLKQRREIHTGSAQCASYQCTNLTYSSTHCWLQCSI